MTSIPLAGRDGPPHSAQIPKPSALYCSYPIASHSLLADIFSRASRHLRQKYGAPCKANSPNMVGAAGFEPAASCSQSRHSTRLSYAPTAGKLRSIGNRCKLDFALSDDRKALLQALLNAFICDLMAADDGIKKLPIGSQVYPPALRTPRHRRCRTGVPIHPDSNFLPSSAGEALSARGIPRPE